MLDSANEIQMKKIDELLKYSFYIPSYQRGYRWTRQQVIDLLDDLSDFSVRKKPEEFYCLQPVIVKHRQDLAGMWEVIDGQQRLTTIYLILYYINNHIFQDSDSIYSIQYETRPESEKFLTRLDHDKKDQNIDFFHIYQAFEHLKEWFESKGNPAKTAMRLYPILLEFTKIIWYQIHVTADPIEIFTRINLGKIPLTNAELIKALFLKKDNFGDDTDDSDKIRLKQLEIAGEWDRIEYFLQNDEFWYFLNNGTQIYETRIEFIFDMMAVEINQKRPADNRIPQENNAYFSFLVFNQLFLDEEKGTEKGKLRSAALDRLWLKIKRFVMTFEEWFSNRELYHLVGYLVSIGVRIENLKAATEFMTKLQLVSFLKLRIKSEMKLKVAIDELEYSSHKREIKNVLLLFNILSLLANKNSNIRFPFDRYKIEKWDIEHIHAVQSEMPNNEKLRIDWLRAVENELEDKVFFTKIKSLNADELVTDDTAFENLYLEIIQAYGENEDVNDISNLTLLDSATNRSYKNAIFPIKRKVILENDKKGTFIPLCTKNVFLKYYSDDIQHMTLWGKKDREQYLAAIVETIQDIVPEPIRRG